MTPSRSKVSPKPTKAFDRKSLTPSKKPTSGPNVVNKLTAGPSTSKMDKKAMLDKMTRKGSGVSPKLPLGGLGKAVVDKMTRKGSGVKPTKPSNTAVGRPTDGPNYGPRRQPPTKAEMAARAAAGRDAKMKLKAETSGPNPAKLTYPAPAMKKGGCVKKYARGGGVEVRGKTKGRII